MQRERGSYEHAVISSSVRRLGGDEVALAALIGRASELRPVNDGEETEVVIPLGPLNEAGEMKHFLGLRIDPVTKHVAYQLFKDGKALFVPGHLPEVFEIKGDRYADPENSTLIFRSKDNRGLFIYPGRIAVRVVWPFEQF